MAIIGGRQILSQRQVSQGEEGRRNAIYNQQAMAEQERQAVGLAKAEKEMATKKAMADEANAKLYQGQVEYKASGIDYGQARDSGVYNFIDEALKNPQSEVARFEQDGSLSIAQPNGQIKQIPKLEVDAYVLAHKKNAPEYDKTLQTVMAEKNQGLAIELTEGQKPPKGFEDIVTIGGKTYARKTKGAQSTDYQLAKEEEVMQKRNSIATADANAEVERVAVEFGDGQIYTKEQVKAMRDKLPADKKFASVPRSNTYALVPKDLNVEYGVKGKEEKPEKEVKVVQIDTDYKKNDEKQKTIIGMLSKRGLIKGEVEDEDIDGKITYTPEAKSTIQVYNELAMENPKANPEEIIKMMRAGKKQEVKEQTAQKITDFPVFQNASDIDKQDAQDAIAKGVDPVVVMKRMNAKYANANNNASINNAKTGYMVEKDTPVTPKEKAKEADKAWEAVKEPIQETPKIKVPPRKENVNAKRSTDSIKLISKPQVAAIMAPEPSDIPQTQFMQRELARMQKKFQDSSDNEERSKLKEAILFTRGKIRDTEKAIKDRKNRYDNTDDVEAPSKIASDFEAGLQRIRNIIGD